MKKMHYFLTMICCLLLINISTAQLRLDVEGDAKIQGRMEVISKGSNNLFIGLTAGAADASTGGNTFVGSIAGQNNSTGFQNTFLGGGAGNKNTTGAINTFLGNLSGFSNISGSNNTFVGVQAGRDNTEGNQNTFVGNVAGNTNTKGNQNTFVGYAAGLANMASDNTFIGTEAGRANSTGFNNTFLGKGAGKANTTGLTNTFIGKDAGLKNVDGSANTFIGALTGNSSISGNFNTYVGREAAFNNSTGENNTMIGYVAGFGNNGSSNVFMGQSAGALATGTSSENTLIGTNAGQGLATAIANYNQCTFIGFNAGPDNGKTLVNSMALGNRARVNANNNIAVGNTAITSIKGQVSFTTFSDGRFKRKIKEDVPGLNFILDLRPVTYQLDVPRIADFLGEDSEEVLNSNPEKARSISKARTQKSKIRYSGFLAQEVELTANRWDYEFSGVDKPQNEKNSLYGLRYAEFVVPLVKAVQEQQDVILNLENKVAILSALVERLLEKGQTSQGNNKEIHLKIAPSLNQNQPNPFHENTLIDYILPETVNKAYIQVTTVDGKILSRVNIQKKGHGQVAIKATTYPAGTYYYSLVVDGQVVETKKMVLTK